MTLGKTGEDLAARYLQQKHYRIVRRNFRSKIGEIDIIAKTGRTLVFCEVKTRLNERYGKPFEAVTFRKQSTIRKVAEMYVAMAVRQGEFEAIRFDVVSVLANSNGFDINHIENAF